MQIAARPRVLLRHCDSYDAERIRTIVRESMEELDLRPSGRTLLKPNLVASGPQFPFAYTRPEVTEGVLLALRDRDHGAMTELAVGERCGITLPTRLSFEQAEYDPMLRRLGAKRYCFEEEPQVEVRLSHRDRLRDYLFTPEPVAKADFFVNVPKFKAHPWTTVTFSIKAYIGIQDDRHRLIDHDHRLDQKIRDLQHIVQPELIVIDAIVGGEGRMLTPRPFPLHMLIIGNNQVAFDAVCCAILGLDARSIPHIALTAEAGFGPISLDEIEIGGDVTLAEARRRALGFDVGLVRVEKFFEGTAITAYAGPPPRDVRPESTDAEADYCWGGCPGAIEEAIEILRQFDRECDAKMKRLHIVFGGYEGGIDAKPGEKVVFVGDCARWKGKIGDQLVEVQSLYRDRSTKDPYLAKHEDVFVKMADVAKRVWDARDASYVRFEGCPVSVAEQVLMLCRLGGIRNPILDPKNAIPFTGGYLGFRAAQIKQRATGKAYQTKGPTEHGRAKPEIG